MGTPIRTVTRDELLRRREEILAELGMTHEELARLDETRPVSIEEWDARDELEQISFLLGEELV